MKRILAYLLLLASLPVAADPFSKSTQAVVAVTHMKLDLRVSFNPPEVDGQVELQLARSEPRQCQELVLDTKNLQIKRVISAGAGCRLAPLGFSLGPADPVLGSALRISLPPAVHVVRIDYRAGREAEALQWLGGKQTHHGRPFLYTQSGTIHARSWIPVQDSPSLRFTWEATVRVPPGLVPVMSATCTSRQGNVARFRMSHPVPAYLIGLAVGDLSFRAWSPRMGIFAERPVVASAHREFRDAPRMLEAAERLFGPYRWERYDLLVMPPAFPYCGVENAQLTFVTPTLLVGDQSQVSVIAHELAHAWAGNLVTQETWNDVWLNEGLAVYLERRIVEELYGAERAVAEAVLGRHRLLDELPALPPEDQRLRVDFTDRDPDQVLSSVPYEKGYLFFLWLEREFGRERLDAFLRCLFHDRAFQAINTDEFLDRLRESLPAATKVWIEEPGLPADAPLPSAPTLDEVGQVAASWAADTAPASDLKARTWSPDQWGWFLTRLPRTIHPSRLCDLDRVWRLSHSRNTTILIPWLRLGIRCKYAPALAQSEGVLRSVGRGSIILPIFEELLALPGGDKRAAKIYRGTRKSYHPVLVTTLDRRINLDARR